MKFIVLFYDVKQRNYQTRELVEIILFQLIQNVVNQIKLNNYHEFLGCKQILLRSFSFALNNALLAHSIKFS